MIVEKVTGRTLSHELHRRVFRPAGMARTVLPVTFPFLVGPHASGYYRLDPAPRVELTELVPSFAWGSYGIVSTRGDVERFYRALFTGRLLPPPLVRRMVADPASTGHPVWPRYGLGLEEMLTTCGVRLWGHTGAVPGYQTLAFGTADGARQVIVSTNLYSPRNGQSVLRIVNVVNIEFCGEPWHPGSETGTRVMAT